MRQEQPNSEQVRMSVVLDADLAEYVRIRAFETRQSRSAYVRELVSTDALRQASSTALPKESSPQ
jgi:hypothetical protein